MSGPSFDDVPASAAPNRFITESYSYRNRSRSPVYFERDDFASRPSQDAPYRLANERWDEEADMHMSRQRIRDHRDGDLPPLQAQNNLDGFEEDAYRPLSDDDPTSYDLVGPAESEAFQTKTWNLEKQSQALFSKEHLQVIFGDPGFLLKFTSYLGMHRPQSVPILVHYLDSLKALRALHYANAILEGLDAVPGLEFTKGNVEATVNAALLKRANDAFDYLVREELPAYVTHQYIDIVSISISARISGMLAPHLREASEGLAEVFCLTDPSRPDNPIVFASEEFNRTTQYGLSYVLGRNCRFLQGPYTNPLSVRRLREACEAGRQHQEVFLNYRRDGSPFMNLLMMAPLSDSRGVVRYFIGAQVDVSGLVKDCSDMQSLERLLEMQSKGEMVPDHQNPNPEKNDELRELSEMLNINELTTIRKYGGRMHREVDYDDDESVSHRDGSVASNQPRLLIKDPTTMTPPLNIDATIEEYPTNGDGTEPGSTTSSLSMSARLSGRLSGIYNHYLLIRPYPSLRILFASPSQRVPGILQSPFMNKIGGSNRVRDELTTALADGRGVTAKVRWVTKHDEEGRNKWIHCTPLIGVNGQIGVWMVVIVDDERHRVQRERERPGRMAPPVASDPRGRATPDRHDISQKDRSREITKNGRREPSQAATSTQRYGHSSGNRAGDMVDRTKDSSRANSVDLPNGGGGSVESFRI